MAWETGTSNCPSCDCVVPGSAAICPACGFRLVTTTDAQVVLGLLRGDTAAPPAAPAPPPPPPPAYRALPPDAAPTEVIPAVAAAPVVTAPVSTAPDRLGVDSLFLDHPAPGTPVAPPAVPRPAGPGRPGLLDRLGDLPLPGWLAGGGRGPADGRPSRAPLLIALGLVVLILAGVTFAIAGLAGSLGAQTRRTAAPAAPVVVTLTPVDAAGITAEASSTLHPDTRGYQARNTLDGRTSTAWNSDGDKVGRGVGVRLTWTFDQARDVRRITVRNGYVKSSKDPDVFRNNGRLKRVKITADGTSTEWTLKDTPDQQALTFDLGSTGSVSFEVLEVYQGAKYKDLALTDIRFDAAG